MAAGLRLFSKGAEAVLYLIEIDGLKLVVKQRISKPYRHPVFDKLFRYYRTRTEAKVLTDLFLNNVNVPAVFFVDLEKYLIIMEYIHGKRLLELLGTIDDELLKEYAFNLGKQVGIMHSINIFHGDLTLANIIVRDHKLYLIDFGLAGYSRDIEEYAIDIHLLRRNLLATEPDKTNIFLEAFWKGYQYTYKGNVEEVKNRIEEIRLRGRYVEERLQRKIWGEKYIE